MWEILISSWELLVGLGLSAWSIVTLVAVWGWDVLYNLHVNAPRLEGLLIGVSLAWVMLRRDKHPLLRVLSAPLKLVVDILDLAWDQVVEVIGDLWGTARGWISGSWGWLKAKVVGVYDSVMSVLKGLRDRLKRKSE